MTLNQIELERQGSTKALGPVRVGILLFSFPVGCSEASELKIGVLKAENIVLVDILDAEDERIKNDLYSELPGSPADGTQHFHCRA